MNRGDSLKYSSDVNTNRNQISSMLIHSECEQMENPVYNIMSINMRGISNDNKDNNEKLERIKCISIRKIRKNIAT